MSQHALIFVYDDLECIRPIVVDLFRTLLQKETLTTKCIIVANCTFYLSYHYAMCHIHMSFLFRTSTFQDP